MPQNVCWLLPLIFAYMCVRHNVGAHSSLLASRRAEVRERLWLCQDCILHFFVLTSLCCGYVKLKFL